jgi:hypothetical protein
MSNKQLHNNTNNNNPDIVVCDNKQGTCLLIDIEVPDIEM